MSPAPFQDPVELMSHRKNALLLDEILHADANRLEARLVVRSGTSFSDSSGNLPAWVGPEIMAQAISALSGWRSLHKRGHLPGIGLLLGIRSYAAPAGDFPSPGPSKRVSSRSRMRGMSVALLRDVSSSTNGLSLRARPRLACCRG